MMSLSLHLLTPTTLSLPKHLSSSTSLFLTPYRRFPVTTTTAAFPSLSMKASATSDQTSSVLVSSNGTSQDYAASTSIEVDAVTETELRENGFRSTRRTKLICTIGPASSGFDQLEALAVGGMKVARLNMCHGTRNWHRTVIERVRKLNEEKGYAVAIMMDTEGSEIHMGDLGGASSVQAEDGEIWTFSVRAFGSTLPERTINVNYCFAEDVEVGDELLVDGGMVRFEVVEKLGWDVNCKCTDPGLLLPRTNLTFWRDENLVRERNAMLPMISSKDWLDIDFGIAEGVDFIAVSFVKSAEVINHLKSYIAARSSDISVVAKIESVDSLKNLEDIIRASDGAMVARDDLGAQIPLEQVPSAQQIVQVCRQLNKPVIVASQLLESMIQYPTPTTAEVADVSEAVRQRSGGFAEDVKVGDELLLDGGMMRFEVVEKLARDVKCKCTDPGLLLPRANLRANSRGNLTFWRDGSLVRERNAMLLTIPSKAFARNDRLTFALRPSSTRRSPPKNLRYPRQAKIPPDFGVNQFLKKPTNDADEPSQTEEKYTEDDNIVWESDEIEAIQSLFQGRVPQKPGILTRQRPLPLPLPYKVRPQRLPTPKKNVVKIGPISEQVYKNPNALVGLAKEIRSLRADKDVGMVLNKRVQFLRKGSLSLTIRELGHMGLPERALQTFCWAQKQPQLYPDDRILSSTVEVLARNHELKLPFYLDKFTSSASRGVIEAMVRGFIKGGSLHLAWKLVSIAKDNQRKLDPSLYAKLIVEFGKNPDKHMVVMALLEELGEREDLKLSQQDCTAIMKVCIRLGRFEVVESVYDWFRQSGQDPTVVIYTTLIHSRYSEKRYKEALAVVWEMEASNCLLDFPAYRVVIKLFVALNDLARVARYFSKLKEAGFTPTYDVYRDLIRIYMVSGRLAKCREICKEVEMGGLTLDQETISHLSQLEQEKRSGF